MITKKTIALLIVFCLSLAGCAGSQSGVVRNAASVENPNSTAVQKDDPADTEPTEEARTIIPLPDTTMENLTDAILSVSLEEGRAYVDDTGKCRWMSQFTAMIAMTWWISPC